jgi:hypothetical protein
MNVFLNRASCFALAVVFLGLTALGPPAAAGTLRTQTIGLQAGWNAVFLEVTPSEALPATVFAGLPVDIVASYYAPSSVAQFMANPGVDLFRQTGWGVWYSEDRPDAFLKTLHFVNGQQAYLVHAKTGFTWRVTGAVVPAQVQWQPGGFNFVGFSVDAVAAPTFAAFFSGSKAQLQNRIYRLVGGNWQRVSDPAAESMRSGEAFWIYCDGASKYQGPVRVDLTSQQGLVFGSGPDVLTLRNQTDHPIATRLEHVPSGPDPVPLSIIVRAISTTKDSMLPVAAPKPQGAWQQDIPPLEGGAAIQVPLEARLTSALHSSLLKITTDLGTEIWVPVIGVRTDLQDK